MRLLKHIKAQKLCVLLMALTFSHSAGAQQQEVHDKKALLILDRMSQVIGNLSACSFVLTTSVDRVYHGKTDTENNCNEVYMAGPNKMLVNVNGDKGHRTYYYNGKSLNFYSFDENNYATVGAPSTILETFDSLHATYGIDFPAADFFYPDFTADLVNNSESIEYSGVRPVNGQDCFHILATSKNLNAQIWISNDALMLPKKVVISYGTAKTLKRYEAEFTQWKLNPDLPAPMFEFVAPPGAKVVYLMPQRSQ